MYKTIITLMYSLMALSTMAQISQLEKHLSNGDWEQLLEYYNKNKDVISEIDSLLFEYAKGYHYGDQATARNNLIQLIRTQKQLPLCDKRRIYRLLESIDIEFMRFDKLAEDENIIINDLKQIEIDCYDISRTIDVELAFATTCQLQAGTISELTSTPYIVRKEKLPFPITYKTKATKCYQISALLNKSKIEIALAPDLGLPAVITKAYADSIGLKMIPTSFLKGLGKSARNKHTYLSFINISFGGWEFRNIPCYVISYADYAIIAKHYSHSGLQISIGYPLLRMLHEMQIDETSQTIKIEPFVPINIDDSTTRIIYPGRDRLLPYGINEICLPYSLTNPE